MKLSTTNVPRVTPTPRHHEVGDSGRLLPDPVDMDRAELVGLIRRALDRVRIDAVLDPGRAVARDDGRAGDAMRPGHGLALRVHARADAVVVIRPVHVVLDVFLARPDHLHRPAHVLRDLHGAHGAVELEAAAESAAEQVIVDAHLLALQAGELHDGRLRDARNLRADPDVAAFLRQVHGAVHRLHRRVREERLLVDRVDPCARRRQSPRRRRRRGARPRPAFPRRGQAARRCRPWRASRSAPASHCGAAAARPCLAAQVCVATMATASSSRTTWLTPRTAFAFASSTESELSAEGRRLRQRGELHPRQPRIDAELRGAVHLAGRVEAPVRRSDRA